MKILFTSIGLILLLPLLCPAQNLPDSIHMKQGFWGKKYYAGEYKMTQKQLDKALKSSPGALESMLRSRENAFLAAFLGTAGGLVVGYALGASYESEPIDLRTLGIGAFVVVLGIPLSRKSNEQAQEALDIYNADQKK